MSSQYETPFLVLFGIAFEYHHRRVLRYMPTNVSSQYNTENRRFVFYTYKKTVIVITQEVLSTVRKPACLYRNENAIWKLK